jgi:quercetin dioxygenase-like cupin family protein
MRIAKKLSAIIGIVSAAALAVLSTHAETTHADQAASKTIVLIGGTTGNTPAEHDHPNGIRVLQTILESSPDIAAINGRVVAYPDGWPADDAVLEQAATVVWYFSGLQNHPLVDAERRARFQRLMDRGVGLVALHQASTLLPDDTAIPLSDWLGGARYGMFDRTTETVGFQPADHPISRGVGPFRLRDEFYPTIRFPAGQRVVPILPGTFYVEIENGEPIPLRIEHKTAAWAFERPNGGRGFAFTGLHYLESLDHPQLRRLLLNAIAWTAGLEVPSTGVRSSLPDAAKTIVASVGAKVTEPPAPRAPQTAVFEAVVTREADHQVLEQPWGVLTWYVSRGLKNSDTMTVGRALVRPGQQNPRHYHPNCDEVLQVLQGHILHTMNDVTVELRVGDVVSIPTGVIHNARNIGTEDAILAISFSSADRVAVGYE